MKTRIALLIILLLALAGCGIPFNIPDIGPDGTIAFFVDESGNYDFMPEGGTLTLLKGDELLQIPEVKAEGGCGAISWSRDGTEIVYVDTETGEWGMPSKWLVQVVEVQNPSEVTTIADSDIPVINPAFTPDGDITYLQVDDDGIGHLIMYDRAEAVANSLLENVLSYRPARSDSRLWVIRKTVEGSLAMGHLEQYDPELGDSNEIASFYLGVDQEETLLLFPAAFLWDVSPDGKNIALTLFDQALITPETEDAPPSLYLINTDEESASRIAGLGLAPAFSPDGSQIAYIGSEDVEEEEQAAFLYNPLTWEKTKIPATADTFSIFWIDSTHLGMVMEKLAPEVSGEGDEEMEEAETYYCIISYDIVTGEVTTLIGE
jgi:hypothetical protein